MSAVEDDREKAISAAAVAAAVEQTRALGSDGVGIGMVAPDALAGGNVVGVEVQAGDAPISPPPGRSTTWGHIHVDLQDIAEILWCTFVAGAR